MKTFGIIGAMEEEVSGIKEKMQIVNIKTLVGIEFCLGKIAGNTVVLVRSGIGKVNAAICAQVLVDLYAVDFIINVGVAGACDEKLNVGDLVISSDLVQHDFDTTAFGDPIGTIPRMGMRFFKADEELVQLISAQAKTCIDESRMYIGRIASGDVFVSSSEQKRSIKKSVNPLCVEMEGAAIAQACVLNMIPFAVLRLISDNSDNNANVSFAEFIKDGTKLTAKIITDLIENYK